MKKSLVTITANMDGVGPIGDNDQVFLLVKRCTKDGTTMSREQYPAETVEQVSLFESPAEVKREAELDAVRDDLGFEQS